MNVRFGNTVKLFVYPDAFTAGHLTKGQAAAVKEQNEPQKKSITLIEALRTGGFRCIDNRTTSSILWVLYDPAKKNEFDKIISGYNVQCKLEKRGALATNNAPAWRIMFN